MTDEELSMTEEERNEVFLESQTIRETTFREWMEEKEEQASKIEMIEVALDQVEQNKNDIDVLKVHNHDETYAPIEHEHDDYSLLGHTHDTLYAERNHNHNDLYATKTHNHDTTYSKIDHNHDSAYSAKTHNHDTVYSKLGHGHDTLYSTLTHNHDDVYSKLEHNHNTSYATKESEHTHDNMEVLNGIKNTDITKWNANAPQEYVDTYINPIRINALSFGIQEGRNVDVERNTRLFQDAIDFCKNDKVLVFPSGEFIFNSVDLGEKNNITIVGASSSFATFAQKDIETGEITDTLTKIICNAPKGETFFKHKRCVLIMENIAFYNLKKDNEGNFTTTEAKENIFMQHIRTEGEGKNIEKGKAFLSNCAFYGWKVCFGSEFTFQHLEDAWGTGKQEADYEYIKQSCVMAHRCRFTRNGIAINQTVDGRIVDCSFNKNNYAIVLRENSGFTTIANCRIEWNLENGIYSEKAHDVTVANCEFDCNGYAGLYAKENTNSNFSNNIFRRSGAKIDSTEDESHRLNYEQNSHIYANGNINCNFIGNNTTVKSISDVTSAPERPTNCSYFLNNSFCIINANNLAGCTKQELTDANKIENNTNSIFSSNIGIANN